MSDVFDDVRLVEGEELAEQAEVAERRYDTVGAQERYARAAELYDAVALSVSGLPKARSVIAVSAVCLAARGGRFDRAIRYAERFLAEPGSLTPEGAHELETLLAGFRRALPDRRDEHAASARPLGVLRRSRAQTRALYREVA